MLDLWFICVTNLDLIAFIIMKMVDLRILEVFDSMLIFG